MTLYTLAWVRQEEEGPFNSGACISDGRGGHGGRRPRGRAMLTFGAAAAAAAAAATAACIWEAAPLGRGVRDQAAWAAACSRGGADARRRAAVPPTSGVVAGANTAGRLALLPGRLPPDRSVNAATQRRAAFSNDALVGVQLPPMVAGEPAWLELVILRLLDEEWVEHSVHQRIGEAVGTIYKESRVAGDNDLITVLGKLVHGLKEIWGPAGFGEAFAGPVEVTNLASEILMLRFGCDVLSYGSSHRDIQRRIRRSLREYEAARQSLIDAVGSVGGAGGGDAAAASAP